MTSSNLRLRPLIAPSDLEDNENSPNDPDAPLVVRPVTRYLYDMDRQAMGKDGEAAAHALLRRRGYRVLEHNFRCAIGEIDLIAEQAGTIVFIEVKARAATEFGAPFEAISPHKQHRLARLATWYLARRRWLDRPCRFDAVAVMVDAGGRVESIEVLRDAFVPDAS